MLLVHVNRKWSGQVDPGNVKAALRQWLALMKLGKSDEGDSASLLSRLASSDEMNGETAAHMNAVAADEEERETYCCCVLWYEYE